MDKVRLGVLGAGNIAAMNVRGYLEDPRCDIVAVCDTDEEIGRQAAKEWGAESSYADLADMLADDSIDAVEVLTPTHMHHDHVIAALEAGKHVSVQKPVANSVEDALEMGAVADRVGRTLRISECFVHYPPLELAKRLVAEGAIGKPTSLRIRTLVGQTNSAFQASCAPRATAGASTSGAPAATSSTTWCTSTPWRCGCWTWTSPRCRPSCGGATSSSSRAPSSSSTRTRACSAPWRSSTPPTSTCGPSTTGPTSSSRSPATRGSSG